METAPVAPDAHRPLLLRAICGVALALYAYQLSGLISRLGAESAAPRWYPYAAAVVCVLAAVCLIGIWKLRRWAVLGYVLVTVAHNVILFAVHVWSAGAGLLVPTVVTLVALSTLHRMR